MTDSLARPAGRSVDLDRPPVGWLPDAVRQPISAWRSITAGYLTAFIPSVALSALIAAVGSLLPDSALPTQGPDFATGWMMAFAVVVFSPIVETLIMGGALSLLLRVVSPSTAIVASAAGWGVAHSLVAPAWGLVIWWPFFVFSTLFVAWRPLGWGRAAALVATVHALQNSIPGIMLALG